MWHLPGMRAVAGMSTVSFAGFGVLFATVPLWAVRAGADAAGAGAINGILMLATVLTQTLIPWSLRRLGWAVTLTVGLLALGLPSVGFWLSGELWWLMLLSAVRGLGFGVLTVCGSAAIAELSPPLMRGRAVGAYGFAISAPQILTMTGAPWLAERAGFGIVFALGTLPVLGVPWALALSRRLTEQAGTEQATPGQAGRDADPARPTEATTTGDHPALGDRPPSAFTDPGTHRAALAALVLPVLILLLATSAGGALLTFLPQLVADAAIALAGMFVLLTVATASRWWLGGLVDKRGSAGLAWPLLAAAAGGLVLIGTALPGSGPSALAGVLLGAALVGLAYGGLQSLTLVYAFERAGPRRTRLASTVWNIGFDSGTGLGSVVVGALVTGFSALVALLVVAATCLLAAVLLLLRPPRTVDRGGEHTRTEA